MMTDLFNPTFFMFLGILILVVALVVVYFESKSREQNHKIASMLSLVSTLAEDMNGVKMGLHHLSVNRVGGNNLPRFPQQAQPSLEESNMQLFQNNDDNLIPVSDDESIGDSDDSNDEDSDSDEDCDSCDEDDDNNHRNIKILTLNMNTPSAEGGDFEDIDDLEDLGGIDEDMEHLTDTNSESSRGSRASPKNVLEMLTTHAAENSAAIEQLDGSHINISATDLKTININLDEIHADSIDYKKLPLPKLRSIVTDKGLADDASKLKKPELLKLLEAE
jgi:hypothetical protein